MEQPSQKSGPSWKGGKKILNQPDPPALADIPEADEDLNINMGAITVGEVKEAIRKLRNGKVPASQLEEDVRPEMLKAEDQETPCILQSILQDIWENETSPDDWNTGVIIKLPKKGNLGDCNNWRGITLLKAYCLSPAKSSVISYSNASKQQWTPYYDKNSWLQKRKILH